MIICAKSFVKQRTLCEAKYVRVLTFSDEIKGSNKVTSGFRSSSNVLIYIDLPRAMEEGGLKFYRSQNNVILTPGDANGFVSPRFFSKYALRMHTGSVGCFLRRFGPRLRCFRATGLFLPICSRGVGGGRTCHFSQL